MTTTKLILLRLYLSIFGHFAWPSWILKRVMILFLIGRPAEPHVPSSRFFTPDQLRESAE